MTSGFSGIWAIGNFVGAIGWLAIGIRGSVPDWVSVAMGNARFGGDEFCALLPRISLADARRLAERVRARVASVELDVDGATVSTTVSIGVAPVDPGSDRLDDAIFHADQALYRAKRQGPNRVEV